jgi:glycosyltransferase involved in cell wall biosynthesis
MDVSIVVPFHNEQAHIERCIESLLSQDYPRDRYEIVFVDNNSTDGSAEIVRRYSRVRLLSERKAGSYAARNAGVAASTGDILAFTDSDCSPDRSWLTTITRELAVPDTLVVQGRVRFARESAPLSLLADYENAKAAYVFLGTNPAIYYGYTNNLAVRRGAFADAGPFEEVQRGADVIFVHRVIEAYTPRAIRFSADMCVRHWEIDTARAWFEKLRIYGRSITRYGDVVRAHPLSSVDRWRVLRATIRAGQYPWYRSALLIGLLVTGAIAYESGRIAR